MLLEAAFNDLKATEPKIAEVDVLRNGVIDLRNETKPEKHARRITQRQQEDKEITVSHSNSDPSLHPPTPKARKRGSRAKIPKASSDVLDAWLMDHLEQPYPTTAEKKELSMQSELTLKQVSDYLGNWRKRKWNVPIRQADVSSE